MSIKPLLSVRDLRTQIHGDGPPVLRARVLGRDLPLPLLSVTDDDARLNGTSADRLAQR